MSEIKNTGNFIEGLAIKFNSPSKVIYTKTGKPFIEIIKPDAITNDLDSDSNIRLLVEHEDSKLLGRNTKNLQLFKKEDGIYFKCELLDTELAKDTLINVKNELLNSMSFDFTLTTSDSQNVYYDEDGQLVREVLSCSLSEISCVGNPAYDGTELNKRSMDSFKEDIEDYIEKLNEVDKLEKETNINEFKELLEKLNKIAQTLDENDKGEIVDTNEEEKVEDTEEVETKEDTEQEEIEEDKVEEKEEVAEKTEEVKEDISTVDGEDKETVEDENKEETQTESTEHTNQTQEENLTEEEKEEIDEIKKEEKGVRKMTKEVVNVNKQGQSEKLLNFLKGGKGFIDATEFVNTRSMTSTEQPLLVKNDVNYNPIEEKRANVNLKDLVTVIDKTDALAGRETVLKSTNTVLVEVDELDANPELDDIELVRVDWALKTYRGAIPISYEMLKNNNIGFSTEVTVKKHLNRIVRNTYNKHVINTLAGIGTKEVVPNTEDVVDKLRKEINAKNLDYDNTAVVMSGSLYDIVSRAKDENGRYLMNEMSQPNLYTFFGTVVVVIPDKYFTGLTTDSSLIAFVTDLKEAVYIFDGVSVQLAYEELSTYSRKLMVAVSFDAQPVDTDASKYLEFTPASVAPVVPEG